MLCRIISGKRGEGKTSTILRYAYASPDPKGFVSIHEGDCYYLLNLRNDKKELLMSHDHISDDKIGGWYYRQDVFDSALMALAEIESGDVFIDEIGRLELSCMGFAPCLRKLLSMKDVSLTIAVREEFVERVIHYFCIRSPEIIAVEA